MYRMRSGLLLLVLMPLAALLLVAACAKTETGEVMEKPGETMQKAGETMEKTGDTMVKEGDTMAKEGDTMMAKVPDKIVAPHFVDSVPNHGDVLPQAPNSIVLNFNFNLHSDSSLAVTRDGQPVTIGASSITSNQLSMSAPLTANAGDGVYTVDYKACWPDRSCHEGSVSFVVDSSKKTSFQDMRGKAEVAIVMQEISFSPQRIIVSPGTKVTWTNGDGVVHFVNTDPHPTHNGLPALNSSSLEKGQNYSFTFAAPGIYGYHCSAHTNMT